VLVGSTDRPGPAQAFDRTDDEELAVEMVRVIERLRPATWATILPVTLPAGMEMRSHPELVEEAQREYDNRGHEVRTQAAEVKAEALRRLGRLDDDAAPVVELEPARERGHSRLQAFRAQRRSKREQDRVVEEPVETEPAPVVEAPPLVEAAPVVEEPQPVVMPVPAFLVEAREDVEPAATATIAEEQVADGERGHRRQRFLRLHRQHAQPDEEPADETEVTAVVEEAPPSAPVVDEQSVVEDPGPSEVSSDISERIAGYAFAYQRRSGVDRRSGIDRRQGQVEGFDQSSDRRAGVERRSGVSRRRAPV
jgi:hypothetical protein